MKIIVRKLTRHFWILIANDHDNDVEIDDEAHRNITSEAEILARAAALHSATGWPVTKEYEM